MSESAYKSLVELRAALLCRMPLGTSPKLIPEVGSAFLRLLAKSLWYENVPANQWVRPGFQKTDISEFEFSHPSHGVRSLRATCDTPATQSVSGTPECDRPEGVRNHRAAVLGLLAGSWQAYTSDTYG